MSHKITDVPGKGKGLVATKEFKIGEIVIISDATEIAPSEITIDNFHYGITFAGKNCLTNGDARYINDAIPVEYYQHLLECMTVRAVEIWILDYPNQSKPNIVPEMKEGKIYYRAIKEISEGDEIQMQYNHFYWMQEIIFGSRASPRTKLSCLLVCMDTNSRPPLLNFTIPAVSINNKYSYWLTKDGQIPDRKEVAVIMDKLQIFGFGPITQHEWYNECFVCRGSVENFKLTLKSCTYCGAPPIHKCGRCKKAKYCNTVCQKKHWKVHKSACK